MNSWISLWKAARKEQELIVLDRSVDKGVAYRVARQGKLKQQAKRVHTHIIFRKWAKKSVNLLTDI